MSNPEKGELYKENFPFTLRSLEYADVSMAANGGKRYVIDLNLGRTMPFSVEGGMVVGNEFLNRCRIGQSPAKEFYRNGLASLDCASAASPTVLADRDHPMRWSSAGSLIIFNDGKGNQYVPLNLRSPSGFYANRLGDFAGMSNKPVDWLLPEGLARRETVEELILVRDKKIVFPNNQWFTDKERKRLLAHQRLIAGSLLEIRRDETGHFSFEKSTSVLTDRVDIRFKGQVFSSDTVVHPDPDTASMELRYVMEINMDPLDGIVMVDGETEIHRAGKPINRNIFLFKSKELVEIAEGTRPSVNPVCMFHDAQRICCDDISFRRENFTPTVIDVLKRHP